MNNPLWGWKAIEPSLVVSLYETEFHFTIHLWDVPPRLGVAGDELPSVGVGPPEALPAAAHDHRPRRVVRRAQLPTRLGKVGNAGNLQDNESLCLDKLNCYNLPSKIARNTNFLRVGLFLLK